MSTWFVDYVEVRSQFGRDMLKDPVYSEIVKSSEEAYRKILNLDSILEFSLSLLIS